MWLHSTMKRFTSNSTTKRTSGVTQRSMVSIWVPCEQQLWRNIFGNRLSIHLTYDAAWANPFGIFVISWKHTKRICIKSVSCAFIACRRVFTKIFGRPSRRHSIGISYFGDGHMSWPGLLVRRWIQWNGSTSMAIHSTNRTIDTLVSSALSLDESNFRETRTTRWRSRYADC